MRRVAFAGLIAAILSLLGPEGRAQQGYFNRTTVSRFPAVGAREDVARSAPGRAGVSENGVYRRATAEEPPRRQPPQAAPVRRNYFPGMPTGQGPNRNYIDPSRLCVPGRRAFIYGR